MVPSQLHFQDSSTFFHPKLFQISAIFPPLQLHSVVAIQLFFFFTFSSTCKPEIHFSMRFFKNIMKTAVGWLQQQVVLEEPPTVIQSITPQVHPQVLSQPRNLVETHLCPRLQLWLKVVSVDLRQVRSWDPDHPANMALTMLWGRHAPLEALQKALVVERFFAGIGKNSKWRLYLAMSRFGLQAHLTLRLTEGKETPPVAGEEEDDGIHGTPAEAAADKALQRLAQTSPAVDLVRCTTCPSSRRIECALRGDYRAPGRYTEV
ncbi:hypothetical protein MGG_07788 [Pyricularia oryzae 70-15]|uniref:Uncharacterized protein n=1 Tax=Pyricularia oryzae (strain 70-15 / ATCC MYA-4617 / FGSC 8958) TaxID=242507 RepID=G4N122_PYRO7|nr:uncharacterized protein MGG_07788 [Pyricularia oryzae 70-15]EHA53198.1 hypothetical protein MGG_07788 [Pyricularia oryzae 70-15]